MNTHTPMPSAAAPVQNEMLTAALEYAARGWHVFPATPGQRKSEVAGKANGGARWGATSDPDTIKGYWRQFPSADLGIACQESGLWVLDLDRKNGEDGVAWLDEQTATHGPLPPTPIVESPTGGRHIYFRYPPNFHPKTCAGEFEPGVDVRGHGGMVIAPPTARHDGQYRWLTPPDAAPVADAPGWLLDLLPHRRERAAPIPPAGAPLSADLERLRWALLWLDPDADGYDKWKERLMAVHNETGGSDAGLALVEEWSQQGEKYKLNGPGEIANKWRGFWLDGGTTLDAIMRDLPLAARLGAGPGDYTPAGMTRSPVQAESVPPPDPVDPVDLWGHFPAPDLPEGLLPTVIEEWARTNAAQMGADPAGLAVAGLVTCAAALSDAIKIKVKRHADWTESARLWAALVGSPSAKKSPIIAEATRPLCALDMQLMRAWQKRVQEYDALSPEEKKSKARPAQTRLRIGDATVEAAQQVLEGSPWGVLLLQDELSGFFGAMDKYGGGKGAQADRAFWLQSFNGGNYALNRVTRGSAIIENLSVSMLGGIQPGPLRKVAGDSVDDGLLQRLFPIMLGPATMGHDEPGPPVNHRYKGVVEALHRLTGATPLQFDDGAQLIRQELEAQHLNLQSLEAINGKLASHIGKYDGMFARLALLFHCIDHVAKPIVEALPRTVSEATARRAATFLHRFLMSHAVAFYGGTLGLSDDHDRLTAIAGYILTHKKEWITNRDVQRGDTTMRGLKDHETRPLLEQLAALGWLDRIDAPRPSSPPHWQVNPAVHAKFAERGKREAERREQARLAIQQINRASTN